MLIVAVKNSLLSNRLLVSRANEDIVVSEPQNPTATSIEYFVSKFQKIEQSKTHLK